MVSPAVPSIFNKQRRAARWARAKALSTATNAAQYLEDDMREEVLERLDFMRMNKGKALVVGALSSGIESDLSKRGFEIETACPVTQDEECPYPGGPYDLLASFGTLDTLNDLPGALIHARNALSDDGLFIGQMTGAGSLPTLRKIMLAADGDRPAARIHPQIDNRAATALLERAGFKRQVVDSRSLKVTYRSFERMIADLREQALTSVLASPALYLGKPSLARAREAFEALKDEEGRVTETFEILTLTGWR